MLTACKFENGEMLGSQASFTIFPGVSGQILITAEAVSLDCVMKQ
jgi:hypothetical protein